MLENNSIFMLMMLPRNNYNDMFNRLYIQLIEFYEYVKESNDDERNVYLVFSALGSFLVDKIVRDEKSPAINEIYKFINDLYEDIDNYINEALSVTVLEHLTDYKKTIQFSREKLKDKALLEFERILSSPMFGGGVYSK